MLPGKLTLATFFITTGILSAYPADLTSAHCPRPNGLFLKPNTGCRKFYFCEFGKAIERKCERGDLFDESIGRCDQADLVVCKDQDLEASPHCPRHNGLFLKRYTGCQKFYQCKNGKATEKECKIGDLFDESIERCERRDQVVCRDKVLQTSPPCLRPNGLFLKPNTGCRKFYFCEFGKAIERKCERGDLFDESIGRCDQADLVVCKDKDTEASPKCPKPNGLFLKRNTGCQKFYQCKNGKAIERECKIGDLFDESIERCEREDQVVCRDKVLQTSPPCPRPNGLFLKPNTGCRKFYFCEFGKAIERKCERGDLFDESIGRCDQADLVVCKDQDSEASPQCPKPNGLFLKRHTGCQKFYQCKNGKATEKECKLGELFDENSESCDWENLVVCKEKASKNSTDCPRPNGLFLKPNTGCRKFYFCEFGKAIERKCERGDLFDESIGRCDQADLVVCKDKDTEKKPCPRPNGAFLKPGSHCMKYYECRNGKAREKDCPFDELFNEAAGKCDWRELVDCRDETSKDPKCPKRNGKFPAKGTMCKSFVICKNGEATVYACPNDWLFNEDTGSCDWPELVNCREDRVSTTTGEMVRSTAPAKTSTFAKTTKQTILYKTSTESTKPSTFPTTNATLLITSVEPTMTETSVKTTERPETPLLTTQNSSASRIITKMFTHAKTSKPDPQGTRDTPTKPFTTATTSVATTKLSTAENTTITTLTSSLWTTLRTTKSAKFSTTGQKTTKSIEPKLITTVFPPTPRGCKWGDPDCKPDKVLCPKMSGLFPHPDDPTLFLHCDHWKPYIKQCPSGLHFDAKKKSCQYPK